MKQEEKIMTTVWVDAKGLLDQQSELEHYLRLEGGDMRKLVKSMWDEGFRWNEPIYIGSDGLIGDGHRRLRAAIEAGIEKVPVVYHDDRTSSQIFKERNDLRKRFDAYQWLRIYLVDGNLEDIPRKYSKDIEKLLVWGFTREELTEFSQKGLGPGIVAYTERILKFLAKDGIIVDAKKVTYWLFKNKMQFSSRKSIETRIHTAEYFLNCINANQPL